MKRLHSFSGILPLSVYLIYHLWVNWAALYSRERWVDRVTWIESHCEPTVEILFFLSLTLHVFLGLGRKIESDHPLFVSTSLRRIQRTTGFASLLFIGLHLFHLWPLRSGPQQTVRDSYAALWSGLSEPGCLALYLVGITVVYFHFAHGLSRAAVSWGLISSERSLRAVYYAVSVVGIGLWGLTLHLLGHFATGQGLFG
ncbi:MAG: hypothetical protein JXA30_20640 [Deltaproteobacteria bacterium]|nr:hypothetical protein [Deltaproteobacteria bacterium]